MSNYLPGISTAAFGALRVLTVYVPASLGAIAAAELVARACDYTEPTKALVQKITDFFNDYIVIRPLGWKKSNDDYREDNSRVASLAIIGMLIATVCSDATLLLGKNRFTPNNIVRWISPLQFSETLSPYGKWIVEWYQGK